MSEEEAIKILKEINVVDFYNTYTDSTTDFSEPRKYCDAIETILDLYNKEKETSHFLQSQLDEANAKLIEEKENNKELRKYYATRKEVEELRKINECLHDSAENYVHKDKIIAKVIEIKDRPLKDEFITATQSKLNTIIDIESLLN